MVDDKTKWKIYHCLHYASSNSQLWYLELVSNQLSTPLAPDVKSSMDGSSVKGSISFNFPFGRGEFFIPFNNRSLLLDTKERDEN